MNIELPKDAKGREIPLDTVALFNRDGNVYSIVRWTFTTDFDLSDGWSNKWRAITDRGFALDPALVYLTTPEPDTWEKLEDDLDRCIEADDLCSYHNPSGVCFKCILDGDGPCHGDSYALKDIKDRIRKLRGEDRRATTAEATTASMPPRAVRTRFSSAGCSTDTR